MRRRSKHASPKGLLEGLLEEGVEAAASSLVYSAADLLESERPFVTRAVESRQREFSTGRVLARRAMARLGYAEAPLLRDEDRVPLWPEGLVGSISHCADLCVVALSLAARHVGIGLDVEPDLAVKDGIERVVCRPEEIARLQAIADEDERARQVRLIFSVKEATYKAFYPQLRTFWSFQDVGVELDLSCERFHATLPEGPEVSEIEGRVVRRAGWILSSVCRRR